MEIDIGFGLKNSVRFGMNRKNVKLLFGKPDEIKPVEDDDDQREEWVYNSKRLTLRFYDNEDENGKVAEISSENKDLTLNGVLLFNKPIDELKNFIIQEFKCDVEETDYGCFKILFFEDIWLELQCTYNTVQTVNWNVLIKEDSYIWP